MFVTLAFVKRERKKEKVAPYQESHLTASYRLRVLPWRWRRV
ncbi:hypothetical protein N7530_001951 [Penicillium desertorum]|uniref:Uncharacterized protein n=1 Tax=Penicillium desertorum TaxID=1303715 RepID=A0A9X0BX69_9EURO|nr:hypothetical protein N7530_001951 [Penicillium desertorum]